MTAMTSNVFRLAVVVLVCAPALTTSSYAVFGTKRYARSTATLPRRRVSTWGVPAAAPLPLQRYYPSEGVVGYPYGQEYVDDYYYYPQDYPYYYTPAVSYYHQRPGYAYYGYDESSDPVDDLQEEIQAEEREERGESLPIGQETWYEPSSRQQQAHRDSYADVNAAFLQNLALSQAYEDDARRQPARYGAYDYVEEVDDEPVDEDDGWTYGSVRETTGYDGYYPTQDREDQEVRELKALAKKARRQGWTTYRKRAGEFPSWVPVAGGPVIALADRKVSSWTTPAPAVGVVTTTVIPGTESPLVAARRGQKEVPLLRPATPVRRPVVQTRARTPTVYDTIKQLLNMEKDLRKDPAMNQPHKRFVTPDEGLVKELSGLKKLAV